MLILSLFCDNLTPFIRIGINVHCLDCSGTNIVVTLLESAVFLATCSADASPGKLRFQQYNHDIRAETIQVVNVYPLNDIFFVRPAIFRIFLFYFIRLLHMPSI